MQASDCTGRTSESSYENTSACVSNTPASGDVKSAEPGRPPIDPSGRQRRERPQLLGAPDSAFAPFPARPNAKDALTLFLQGASRPAAVRRSAGIALGFRFLLVLERFRTLAIETELTDELVERGINGVFTVAPIRTEPD